MDATSATIDINSKHAMDARAQHVNGYSIRRAGTIFEVAGGGGALSSLAGGSVLTTVVRLRIVVC